MHGRILLMTALFVVCFSVPLMATNTPNHWYVPTDTNDIICAADSLDRGGHSVTPGDNGVDDSVRPLRWMIRISNFAVVNIVNTRWLWRPGL